MGPPTYWSSNISVMACFFSKLCKWPFLPKSLSKMRQNNAFSLKNVYFETWGTDAKQLYLCVSESQTFFCTLAFSPINHHMKRFFGFDALRLNICQKAFCERIMLSRDVSPRFMTNIITWWKFYISFQSSLKWNRYLTWFS